MNSKALEKAKQAREIKNKLMLVNGPINSKQLLQILQKTPKEHIYTRQGKGGQTFDYVTGVYVKKVLNYAFGWMWDFQIIDKGKEGNQVWVQGRLTIKNPKGDPMIIKEQFGRADIKFYKDKTKGMLDYGNDLKAASTDALKKCASELGIASDVYGAEEFKEIEKAKTPSEVKVTNYLEQLKAELFNRGATNEKEALTMINKATGLKLTDFKITEKNAQMAYIELLNSK